MYFCSNRKLPSKVPPDSDQPSKILYLKHQIKNYFVCKAMHFGKIQLHAKGCVILDFIDTAHNVRNFLRGTKLVSSFINSFSINVPIMDKPGSWFLLSKCLKNSCGRMTFQVKMQVIDLVKMQVIDLHLYSKCHSSTGVFQTFW